MSTYPYNVMLTTELIITYSFFVQTLLSLNASSRHAHRSFSVVGLCLPMAVTAN